MPAVYTTIAAASSARRRPDEPPKKAAPLTAQQQKEKRDARQEKQERMDAKVRKWMDDPNELANTMALEFDVKPRYILDIFFQGGAHMIHHQEVTNPYNAFKAMKAAELREAGESKDAQELHLDHWDEYNKLSEDDKKKIVEDYDQLKERNYHLRRDTPRGRIQDVSNIVRNMKMLMYGLAQRVGVEGFFVVVRNNVEFKIEPEWYFTSPALENYMEIATRKRWVTGEIGMKLEVFAIAGCDPVNMLRTAKQKIDFMKGEIRAQLSKGLQEVSKVHDARLAWTWFEEDVVQRYGVVLEGWTAGPTPVDPSKLSSSQTVIRTLLDAVKAGECKFRKLGPTEATTRRKKWDEDVATGKVIAKHRAGRSDAGVSRKRTRDEQGGDDGEHDENDPPAAVATGAPPAKRRRTGQNSQRDPRAEKTPAAASKAVSKAASKRKAPSAKKTPVASTAGARNDTTTAAARQKLKDARLARSRVTSRPIITSDDERDEDPNANEEEDAPTAARPVPRRIVRPIVMSEDEDGAPAATNGVRGVVPDGAAAAATSADDTDTTPAIASITAVVPASHYRSNGVFPDAPAASYYR